LAVIVNIPHPLRQFVDGKKEISVKPGPILDILKEIKKKYPELSHEILDDNNIIKGFIKLCVNSKLIDNTSEYSLFIEENQILKLIITISGG